MMVMVSPSWQAVTRASNAHAGVEATNIAASSRWRIWWVMRLAQVAMVPSNMLQVITIKWIGCNDHWNRRTHSSRPAPWRPRQNRLA
jgi:hypothetical protein